MESIYALTWGNKEPKGSMWKELLAVTIVNTEAGYQTMAFQLKHHEIETSVI